MSTGPADAASKIRAHHLERGAYVYIRQSSTFQVKNNLESKRRQYNLVDWVEHVGWPREKIVVVDEDQGKSGAYANMRTGFGNMVAAVGRREVGLIASLEASRLARNSPDWSHLVYICRWTDTLIADEEGIYDPSLSADRLILGIRGQVSELEHETIIQRMVKARWEKAKRGEAVIIPPAGYELDELYQLVPTSDEAVAHAIRTVFTKFDELGTARQVFLWWYEQGLKFPVRRSQLRTHPVVWLPPTYHIIHATLSNPIYAGAYAFGKSQRVRQLDSEDPLKLVVKVKRVLRKDWPILIKDHHMAYISYDKFEKNRDLMRGNAMMKGGDDRESGPVREGHGLSQGLVRCGHCGRRMVVMYGGGRATAETRRAPQYRCRYARNTTGGVECQHIGSSIVDALVVQAFLEATQPAAVEAIRIVEEQAHRESEALANYWKLQIEKAEFEAQRAERQFHAVEPENRTVARELERRWNARLCELEAGRAQAQQAQQAQAPLTAAEIERARRLGADVATIWSLDTTTDRDRKRLLRTLIEEIQLVTTSTQVSIKIVWKGGAITEREVTRRTPTTRPGISATPEDTIELVRQLAREFDDGQIARILNRQGRKTGRGNSFTRERVVSMRSHHTIPACPVKEPADSQAGPFTAQEAARELGVEPKTIRCWVGQGILAATQAAPGAPWRILLTEDIRRRLTSGDAPDGWVGLTEASRRLGLPKPTVAYMVKTGKLKGVRVVVKKQSRWRIEIPSDTAAPEGGLFDPMTNDLAKEA